MKVLLVGGGAREHAMGAALVRSGATIVVAMAHRNPGLVRLASAIKLTRETDIASVVAFAKAEQVDLAVVGPEAPLEVGLVDALEAAGIACASPSKAAARIETDKSWMRDLMARHNVEGRLAHHRFDDEGAALAFLEERGPVWAIKPIGLTGGKGVQVHGDHFHDVEGAARYVRQVFANKTGGGALQFEQLAVGEEFTLMVFTDGATVVPMPLVQDHKRLHEGDQGPNTGGMGSYTQADGLLPFATAADRAAALAIVQGLVDALRADGCPYKGALYGQFMLTRDGPKVIEVNARFGDPEAMNVLHLLASDYAQICKAIAEGHLGTSDIHFRPQATVVKYVVPEGYGQGRPKAGQVLSFGAAKDHATLYYAAVELGDDGKVRTMTSRSVGVLGEGATIAAAEAACERALAEIEGEALFVRHDIGTEALIQRRVHHMQQVRG